MIYTPQDHTFVVCAYKISPYLDDCIKSLLGQTVKSNVIIATSTPNDHIYSIANKYGIFLHVNNNAQTGIGNDWNFAYSSAKTKLITIAHQDDVYEKGYTEMALKFINNSKKPILYFCGYSELRDGIKVFNSKMLNVKKTMLLPLKLKIFWKSRFVRRRILSLGCPICCPSVTFVKCNVGDTPFTNDFLSNIDWQQWEIQSHKRGDFVYNHKPLVCHRIHEGSATSDIIGQNIRSKEDYQMYLKFWPKSIADFLIKRYSDAQKSNNLK